MAKLARADLISLAITWIKEHRQARNLLDAEITEDTDLIADGLLDSFGFVDLFLVLETQCGCKVDLTDVEPNELSTVEGLCGVLLGNYDGSHAHAVTSQPDR